MATWESGDAAARAAALFEEHQQAVYRRTDRIFLLLMPLQWMAAIALSMWLSPLTWAGEISTVHPHVWTALFLGGTVTVFPVLLALAQPGSILTRHVIAAGQMLMSALLIHLSAGSRSRYLQAGEVIALTHHEKWDGSGYPHGLKGEEIPLWGRICAVADVFDALTSARPYEAAFDVRIASEILREGQGTHFDPQLIDLFLADFDEVLEVLQPSAG